MPIAVTLVFDEALDGALRELTAGIHATCGGLDLLGLGIRPHATIASYDDLDVEASLPVLRDLLADSPIDVTLASAGTFAGDAGVVFLAPVVTPRLLEIHARIHAALAPYGDGAHPYYVPRAWVPHVTVAHDVSAEGLGAAWAQAHSGLRLSGTVEALWLLRFEPKKPVVSLAEVDWRPE